MNFIKSNTQTKRCIPAHRPMIEKKEYLCFFGLVLYGTAMVMLGRSVHLTTIVINFYNKQRNLCQLSFKYTDEKVHSSTQTYDRKEGIFVFFFIGSLRQSIAMVMVALSVHLTKLFSSASLTKHLTSTSCTYFRF